MLQASGVTFVLSSANKICARRIGESTKWKVAQALRLFCEINLEILNNVENSCRCCASLKNYNPELKCLGTIAPRKECSSKQFVIVTEEDLVDLFRDVVP